MKSYAEYWYWDKEISHEVCRKIIKVGKGKWQGANTYGSEEKNQSLDGIRKSDIVWITDQWVYDLIWGYMMSANEQAGWKYDIVAAESCQVTRYIKDGFYTWHKDGMGSHNEVYDNPDNEFRHGNTRKLSMSIILNSDYEGGAFEFVDEEVTDLGTGSIIVFPSFLMHKVSLVTKGVRYSLVAWFVGPPFK